MKIPGKEIRLDEDTRFSCKEEEIDEQVMISEIVDDEDLITETDWEFGSNQMPINPKDQTILSKEKRKSFDKIIPDIRKVIATDINDLKECNVRKHKLRTNDQFLFQLIESRCSKEI